MSKALIISANFYPIISHNLKINSYNHLDQNSIKHENIDVPGIFELPGILAFYAKKQTFSGYIILGCVIRGETNHYDHITQEVFRSITDLITQYELPLGLGIITANNYQQALIRSNNRDALKNSGIKAASAMIHMMNLYNSPRE